MSQIPESPELLPDDTIRLVKARNPSLITQAQDGKRKISFSLLTPPSSQTYRSASSSSAQLVESRYIAVPIRLDSEQTFEYAGFTAAKAQELYQAKIEREKLGVSIDIERWAIDYAMDACRSAQDASDNWIKAMRVAGLNEDIQQAMVDPIHDKIRYIQPLSYWIEEMMMTSFNSLFGLNTTVLVALGERQAPAHLRGGADADYDIPQMPGGHLAVFKSVDYQHCHKCIAENGELNLFPLESMGPTDFAQRGGMYFTHQLWVARHYSRLINHMCPVADRRTVELHVPLAHFEHVKTWDVKGDDFKRLLFFSRNNLGYPKDITRQLAKHGVVRGPIANTHSKTFAKMSDWNEVTDAHMLQGKDEEFGGTKWAKQYVWISREAIQKLQVDCVGKAYMRLPEKKFKLIPEPWKDVSSRS
ncbi:hypothetical protein TW65_03179 [Stemphylium lycopersici]|uniref:Uncharacterized protein n=1 Tax=Stemphylium lycopersici TaxID=183478 RepID=A0A364N1I8_STELY|nr:hypothetical protein TW65_03179 [Stemphylium lycopersici]RAR09490.1 hypothetical protein DDE83_005483 [Stemphylium lycopersici]